MKQSIGLIFIVGLFYLNTSSQSQTYDVSHRVIASGGGSSSGTTSNTYFTVDGTIGQGTAGTTSTSSPQFSIRGGFWAVEPFGPTAAGVAVGGRVTTAAGFPIAGVRISLMGTGDTRIAISNAFGYYRFDNVTPGATYIIEASDKRLQFPVLVITVHDELDDVDIVGVP